MRNLPTLEPIFHQTVRTRLGGLLNAGACSFTELKNRLKVTDGNLDARRFQPAYLVCVPGRYFSAPGAFDRGIRVER